MKLSISSFKNKKSLEFPDLPSMSSRTRLKIGFISCEPILAGSFRRAHRHVEHGLQLQLCKDPNP